MKKLFLLLFLTFISLNVHAKWVLVTSTENSFSYVDIESYKRTGHLVRYWELHNYTEPRNTTKNFSYLSTKSKKEINCNTEETLLLAIVDYSEHHGEGKVINSFNYNDKEYKHIVPDTIGYEIYKFVCNKK